MSMWEELQESLPCVDPPILTGSTKGAPEPFSPWHIRQGLSSAARTAAPPQRKSASERKRMLFFMVLEKRSEDSDDDKDHGHYADGQRRKTDHPGEVIKPFRSGLGLELLELAAGQQPFIFLGP